MSWTACHWHIFAHALVHWLTWRNMSNALAQYCTICYFQTQTRTKLIPSVLSWGQQNDLKATFLINVSHQIKRALRLLTNKKIQKRVLVPLTQKWLLPLHQTNSEQWPQIARVKSCRCYTFYYACLIGTWLAQNTDVYIPGIEIRRDSHCIRVVLKHL